MNDQKLQPPARCSVSHGSDDFRKSLIKLLPGYKWTVHKPIGETLIATGIESRGFNRTSTIEIQNKKGTWFESRIAGFGKRSPWLASGCGGTLARAVRSMQEALENQAQIFNAAVNTIQCARLLPDAERTHPESKP